MPISFEEKQKQTKWLTIIIIIIITIAIVGGLIYYFFFAPTPAFETIAPAPLRTAQEISRSQIDPANVLNSQAFRNLRAYAPPPTIGLIGRSNPFLPF